MILVFSLIVCVGAISFFIFTKDAKKRPGTAIVIVAAAILGFSQLIRIIPAGSVGVVKIFESVKPTVLESGLRIVNPFATIINLSVRTQELKEVMNVPSKEGLTVKLEVSALYHLDKDKAAQIYEKVGSNYEDIILIPQFRSVSRGVTASFEAKALYTTAREELSKQIKLQLQELVGPRGVIIESSPLRSVTLPARLTQAIEEKLQAEQESQRMEFILLKEAQEAERKRIEAKGIADFQNIVTKGISEPLLRWKGIEATEKLASSQNAKIVIVGGKDGLPLILGSQ
ncbi:prohibitin family protein [bacterium]